jgi:glycosyltransferase involved in cell wall biosynthesis
MVNPRLRLKLINSLYDVPESQTYAAECIRFIRSTGLGDRVVMSTSFLDQETIMRELADADLAVLPYANSTESASGAICLPLASLTPVLCSDIALFRKFAHVVHFFPAGDTVALANRLLELSTDTKLLRTFADAQRQYVDELAWGNVAREFEAIIDSCGVMVAETA